MESPGEASQWIYMLACVAAHVQLQCQSQKGWSVTEPSQVLSGAGNSAAKRGFSFVAVK